MKKMFNAKGSSFEMIHLATAIVEMDGSVYEVSVEGLVTGAVAIFSDDICKVVGSARIPIDARSKRLVVEEVVTIFSQNREAFSIA